MKDAGKDGMKAFSGCFEGLVAAKSGSYLLAPAAARMSQKAPICRAIPKGTKPEHREIQAGQLMLEPAECCTSALYSHFFQLHALLPVKADLADSDLTNKMETRSANGIPGWLQLECLSGAIVKLSR